MSESEDRLDPKLRAADNVVLGDEPWTLLRTKLDKTEIERDSWGMTRDDERLIEISNKARGRRELDTLIHECLHAPMPWLEEWFIERTATEITNILWKLGYRKVKRK